MPENVVTISDLIVVNLVADAQTPPALADAYGGRIVLVPQAYFHPNTSQLFNVEGVYVQQGNEWFFLLGARDAAGPVLEAIPGPGGWSLQAAKDVYASIGAALIAKGFTLQETGAGLAQLYAAAVADDHA